MQVHCHQASGTTFKFVLGRERTDDQTSNQTPSKTHEDARQGAVRMADGRRWKHATLYLNESWRGDQDAFDDVEVDMTQHSLKAKMCVRGEEEEEGEGAKNIQMQTVIFMLTLLTIQPSILDPQNTYL